MSHTEEMLAERKKEVLARCAAYRDGARAAKNAVRANLGPEVLAKTAFSHIAHRAQNSLNRFTGQFNLKNLTAENLQTVVPFIVSGVSLLSRRGALRPILKGSIVLAAAGAAFFFISRSQKRSRKPR